MRGIQEARYTTRGRWKKRRKVSVLTGRPRYDITGPLLSLIGLQTDRVIAGEERRDCGIRWPPNYARRSNICSGRGLGNRRLRRFNITRESLIKPVISAGQRWRENSKLLHGGCLSGFY